MTDDARLALEIELDTRLVEIWAHVEDHDDTDFIGTLIRAAYGQGHADALTEAEPLSLYNDLGYTVPS